MFFIPITSEKYKNDKVCLIFNKNESSLQKKFVNHNNDIIQSMKMNIPSKTFDGSSVYWTDLSFKLITVNICPLFNIANILQTTF